MYTVQQQNLRKRSNDNRFKLSWLVIIMVHWYLQVGNALIVGPTIGQGPAVIQVTVLPQQEIASSSTTLEHYCHDYRLGVYSLPLDPSFLTVQLCFLRSHLVVCYILPFDLILLHIHFISSFLEIGIEVFPLVCSLRCI